MISRSRIENRFVSLIRFAPRKQGPGDLPKETRITIAEQNEEAEPLKIPLSLPHVSTQPLVKNPIIAGKTLDLAIWFSPCNLCPRYIWWDGGRHGFFFLPLSLTPI